jgi:hypothetical protein
MRKTRLPKRHNTSWNAQLGQQTRSEAEVVDPSQKRVRLEDKPLKLRGMNVRPDRLREAGPAQNLDLMRNYEPFWPAEDPHQFRVAPINQEVRVSGENGIVWVDGDRLDKSGIEGRLLDHLDGFRNVEGIQDRLVEAILLKHSQSGAGFKAKSTDFSRRKPPGLNGLDLFRNANVPNGGVRKTVDANLPQMGIPRKNQRLNFRVAEALWAKDLNACGEFQR